MLKTMVPRLSPTPSAASSIMGAAEATHGTNMTVPAPIVGGGVQSLLRRGWVRRVGRIALVVLAMVGVPVLVVVLTGGQSTVVYWIDAALFSLFAYTIGFWPLWVVMAVPFGLAMWVVGKFSPVTAERIGRYFTPAIWILGGTSAFLVMGPTPDSGVDLPTGYPRAGALLVMLGASLLSAGLLVAVRRLQLPTQDLAPITPSRLPAALPWHAVIGTIEPDEEFWSPEVVVGWRAWQWTGAVLRGVVTEWPTQNFIAWCEQCSEPPGWEHPCGVYAVARPSEVRTMFPGKPDVVGRVELSGLVIEHESGYRASHARILDLWTGSAFIADWLSDLYPDVNVHRGYPPDDREAMSWPT